MYGERRNAFGKKLTGFPKILETFSTMKEKLEVEMATTLDMVRFYDKKIFSKAVEFRSTTQTDGLIMTRCE